MSLIRRSESLLKAASVVECLVLGRHPAGGEHPLCPYCWRGMTAEQLAHAKLVDETLTAVEQELDRMGAVCPS